MDKKGINSGMTRTMSAFVLAAIAFAICLFTTSCSSASFEGEYQGENGSTLLIYDDGTLELERWNTARGGEWTREDEGTYTLMVDGYDYEIIATLNDDGTVTLRGDGSFNSQVFDTEQFEKEE